MFENKLGHSFSAVVICMLFLHTPAWSMDSQSMKSVDPRVIISSLKEQTLTDTGKITPRLVSTLELSLHILRNAPDSTSLFKPSFIVKLFKSISHVDSQGIDLLAGIKDKDKFLRELYLSVAGRLEASERESLLTALETWIDRKALEGNSVELKTPERSEPSLSPSDSLTSSRSSMQSLTTSDSTITGVELRTPERSKSSLSPVPSDSVSSSRSPMSSLTSTRDSTTTEISTASIASEAKRPTKTLIAPFRKGRLTASDVNFLRALHQADPLTKIIELQKLSQGDHRAATAIAHMRQIDPKRRVTPGNVANMYWTSLQHLRVQNTLQEMTLSNAIALNNLAALIESNPNNLPDFIGTNQLLSWLKSLSNQTFYPPKLLYDLAARAGLREAIGNAKNVDLKNYKRSIADPAEYYPSLHALNSPNEPLKIHPIQTAAPIQNGCASSATMPIQVQNIPFIPVRGIAVKQAQLNATPAHTYPQTVAPRNFGPQLVPMTAVPQLQQVPMQMIQQRQQPTLILRHSQQLQTQPVQPLPQQLPGHPQQLPMPPVPLYQTTATATQGDTMYPFPFKTAAGINVYFPVSTLKKLQMDLNKR